MCPTALGRKEKKLYNVHIVQCNYVEVLQNCTIATVLLLKSFHIRRSLFLITGRHYNLPDADVIFVTSIQIPIV